MGQPRGFIILADIFAFRDVQWRDSGIDIENARTFFSLSLLAENMRDARVDMTTRRNLLGTI